MKTHLLFVCTENLHRSPTGESIFKKSKKYEAKSAGVSLFAEKQINDEVVNWADIIIVMEEFHKNLIIKNFPESKNKKIIVLGIPDMYRRNDPELIEVLIEKLKKHGIF